MPSLKELETWLSTSQAASKLGATRQGTVWMAENRRVRAVKTAIGWLYDPGDVARVASERGEAGSASKGKEH